MNITSNKTRPISSHQFQQITHFGNQHTPQIKHETIKPFIPSPELIVDESRSSSSESNEKFIINNHHRGISVSGNTAATKQMSKK